MKRRMVISVFWIVLGTVLIGLHLAGQVESFWSGGAFDPVVIAVRTAVVDIICNMADKVPQTVVFLYSHFHTDGGGEFQQTIAAGLILFPGVDIGIIPERYRFDALCAQRINAGKGAGSTTGMQQNSIHIITLTSVLSATSIPQNRFQTN